MVQLRRSSRSSQGGAKNSRGFTIIEVLVSAFILGVGLTAVAGLVGSILAGTTTSEQMTQAATLATEKLEDLNRYPATDPNVAVTSGTSAGSLTSDSSAERDRKRGDGRGRLLRRSVFLSGERRDRPDDDQPERQFHDLFNDHLHAERNDVRASAILDRAKRAGVDGLQTPLADRSERAGYRRPDGDRSG